MKSQQSIVPTLKWVCPPGLFWICQRKHHVQTFRKCRWIPTHGGQMTGCPLRCRFWSQLLFGSSCWRLKRGSWRIFLCEVFEFQLCMLSDTWAIVWSWLFICLHCRNIMNSPPEFTQVCAEETGTTLKHKEIVVYSKSSFASDFACVALLVKNAIVTTFEVNFVSLVSI